MTSGNFLFFLITSGTTRTTWTRNRKKPSRNKWDACHKSRHVTSDVLLVTSNLHMARELIGELIIRYRTMQRDRIRTGRWESYRPGKNTYQERYSPRYNYWRDDAVYNREDNYYPSQRDQYPRRPHYADRTAPRRSRSPTFTRPSPTYEPADLEPHLPEPRHQQRSMSPRPSPHRLVESPKPDPAYIALAEQSSIPSCNPATSRKLLVLDLNGTLLFRAARSHRRGHTYHGEGSAFAAPRLRTVYPRPYIPAFRAYLFAPETRAWLDTMVWSSAQPHSVEDMVSRAFADHANELVAVWDRKSLGLTQEQYRECFSSPSVLLAFFCLYPTFPGTDNSHSILS